MNKKHYLLFALTAIILLGLGSVLFSDRLLPSSDRSVLVTTVAAEVSPVNDTPTFSGKLEPLESANVISKITGRVGAVQVEIGSQVKAGATLVILDAQELAAAVSQAQAAVEVARSNLQNAQLDYETAQANYERNKTLLEEKILSPSDFDNKFAMPLKKAEQQAQHGAPSQLQQALAALELAQANYQNSIISAPFNGLVTAKNISPGELATTSLTLVTLVNIDKVVAQFAVDENYINLLKTGDQLPVRVGAVSNQPFTGVITNISPAASANTKGFTVRIQVDNPDHLLKPGMFAEAYPGGANPPELAVPKTAVFSEAGQSYVWIVEQGTVAKREVVTGTAGPSRIAIKTGLTPGQLVVTSAVDQLQAGMSVKTQP